MIADDEMLERKAMRKFLETNFHRIHVVGEAINGREAIELAEKLKPDFMLIDINMPGINGIEAIRQIRKEQKRMKFILVSAYDSFEYAKEAMKEGVKEYILKPGKKEETKQAIRRVCEEIASESTLSQQKEDYLYAARENFLLKIVQSEVREELRIQQRQLFPDMHGGFFFVSDLGENREVDLLPELLNRFSPFPHITVPYGQQYVSLLISSKEQFKLDALILAKKIVSACPLAIWIGIGYFYESIEKLPNSYHEALKTLRALKKDNRVLYSLPYVKKEDVFEDEIDELFSAIFKGEIPTAFSTVLQILDKMEQHELYIKMREKLVREGITIQHLSLPQSKSEWKEFIEQLRTKVLNDYNSNDPIEKAKKYIDLHYQDSITLEQVAEIVKLSPTYFTKVFKENTESTFIDYLTVARLTRARQLLSENQYSLKEITHMIGYKDPNYFSRVFKKRYSISPKNFQIQKYLNMKDVES